MKWESPFSDNSTQAITETHKYLIIRDNREFELTIFAFNRARPFGRRKLSTTRHKSTDEARKAAERHAKSQ